jgi:hypothetical protein
MTLAPPAPRPFGALMMMLLPGPDRKRSLSAYRFRVTYRNPVAGETGCVMTWEVSGGRQPYQIALERTDDGDTLWHCSCADAVYRGEDDPKHLCKHVRGLIDSLPTIAPPVRQVTAAAA